MKSGIQKARLMGLEAAQSSSDGAGGYARNWQEIGRIWVHLRPMSGRADDVAGLPSSTKRYRGMVRASPDGSASRPRPGQRFRDGQAIYQIASVGPALDAPFWLDCDLICEVMV